MSSLSLSDWMLMEDTKIEESREETSSVTITLFGITFSPDDIETASIDYDSNLELTPYTLSLDFGENAFLSLYIESLEQLDRVLPYIIENSKRKTLYLSYVSGMEYQECSKSSKKLLTLDDFS